MIVSVDRTKPFGDIIGRNNITEYYNLCFEDQESKAIMSFDLTQLSLELLFEGNICDIDEANELIKTRIVEIKKSGFVLADAHMGELLLKNSSFIPKKWSKITDSDFPGADQGSLRFDGSQYALKTDSSKKIVLAPFVARGRWGYGMVESLISRKEKEYFRSANNGRGIFMRYYTVVLSF